MHSNVWCPKAPTIWNALLSTNNEIYRELIPSKLRIFWKNMVTDTWLISVRTPPSKHVALFSTSCWFVVIGMSHIRCRCHKILLALSGFASSLCTSNERFITSAEIRALRGHSITSFHVAVIIKPYASSSAPGTKWPPFCRRCFLMHFREWKVLYFELIFTEVSSQCSNRQLPRNGLYTDLAPNRRQAIIWTNADPIHWRIYVALGRDELISLLFFFS